MMRRILIVSPHFPPFNAPDMQRVRMSLPHYRASGWEPIVLCVGAAWQHGVLEQELDRTLPTDVRIVRTKAFDVRWSRLFGVRNLGLRCFLHFLRHGSQLIRRERIDLVLFSNTQFVTFALGRIWRFLHGTPYVFDMQDPWRTDYYSRPGSRRPPGGWKHRFARFTAWALEGWSFRRVAGIISVSPEYVSDLRGRYPWLARVPAAMIPFGTSRRDLELALTLHPRASFARENGEIHVVYTGASGPVMPHAVRTLLEGFRRFRDSEPANARRFRFHFLGTSYAAPGEARCSVLPLAEALGVADQVSEQPHRLGHLECLRLQSEADILFLGGSSDPAYSPSKLYQYFAAGRPILAVVFPQSVLEAALAEFSGAFLVHMGPSSAEEASARLERFFRSAVAGFPAGSLPVRDEQLFAARYHAESTTRRQCELFDAAHAFAAGATQPALSIP